MEGLVKSINKKISSIDFRDIYPFFKKNDFFIVYKNDFYGVNEHFVKNDYNKDHKFIIRNNKLFVIKELTSLDECEEQIIIELIENMFEIYLKNNKNILKNSSELDYLISDKNEEYYQLRFQINYTMTQVLAGDLTQTYNYYKLMTILRKKYLFYNLEENILFNKGLKKYVYLRILYKINIKRYQEEIAKLNSLLNDPYTVINLSKYLVEVGCAQHLVNKEKNFNNVYTDYKVYTAIPIINFKNLEEMSLSKIRRIMMYKMIHAKKLILRGKLIKTSNEKLLKNNDLYYFGDYIIYSFDGNVYKKHGEFVAKMQQDKEILEIYECVSIDKVFAN